MNTQQLKCALQQDPVTCMQLGGVCAVDQLPNKIKKKPSLYIVNTDPIRLPGTHWISLYFPILGPAEFFDSAGRHPSFYHPNFVTFLKRNADSFVYNDKALQGLYHPTCGQFCLCFSFMRCRGISLEFIVNQFSNNKNVNDRDVIQFVKSHYDLTVAFCKNVLVQTAVCLL